jgi:hypothetical protein
MGAGGSGFRPIARNGEGIAEPPLDGICRTGYLTVSDKANERGKKLA